MLIVILAGVALAILMVGAYLFVKSEGRKVVPLRQTEMVRPVASRVA